MDLLLSSHASQLLVVTSALAWVGCATVDDPVPATPLPESYAVGGTDLELQPGVPAPPSDVRWWLAMNDPSLNAVVEVSLAQNLTLSLRQAQILQAEALADQARAARFPQVRLQGQIGWSRGVSAFGSSTQQSASVSLPVSYEVDLFARYARLHSAAKHEALATLEDYRSAQISTSAQVAEAFYDLVVAQARVVLVTRQLEVNEQFLELVMLRFREGLVASLDVHQQRQQSLTARANLELGRGQVEIAERRLAALLGSPTLEPRLRAEDRVDLPELGPPPSPGVPAALLSQRPDVRAARQRVEAADRRVAAAVAAWLPSIRLTATPGYSWVRNEFGEDSPFMGGATTASGFTFNTGASFDMPLFDGLAAQAGIDLQSAQMQAQIETLHNVLLQALIEVETSLVQEAQQRRNLELLAEQIQVAEQTLEAARERYRSGLSDFLPVLTALQAKQSTELSHLQAQRNLISARIQLHRSLGGRWPEAMDAEPSLHDVEEES